jgi:hypothetical protein
MIAVMAKPAARARADAVEAFAAALRDLRESVDNPSFREMSGRSRAISHTTLHEAAQGNRLPSWATTVEFVKACGADPAAYRERWEQADRVMSEHRASNVPISPEPARPDPSTREPRKWRRLRFVLPVAAAVVAAAVTVVVVAVRSGTDSPAGKPNGTDPALAGQLSPADCPIHSSNPPPAPPTHAGDASAFIADITLPDCSHIRSGQKVTKVWRLKNVGKVHWTGYSLHRLDLPQQRNQCQTISDIPIGDTAPGQVVDIKTDITAPKNPGFCFARFKMMDAAGHVVFPGSRPVNFQLIVD